MAPQIILTVIHSIDLVDADSGKSQQFFPFENVPHVRGIELNISNGKCSNKC